MNVPWQLRTQLKMQIKNTIKNKAKNTVQGQMVSALSPLARLSP